MRIPLYIESYIQQNKSSSNVIYKFWNCKRVSIVVIHLSANVMISLMYSSSNGFIYGVSHLNL
jgi:hypothetical protein